jgi:hypothetical protein
MNQHILLVEPKYYSQFPPIGLLKLSTLEKEKGNTTELIRKLESPKKKPDKIYVTSLFTWAWRPVWQSIRKYKALYPEAEILLGGIYASILPEHAKMSGANIIHEGIFPEAEDLLPDYSLAPKWNGSIIHASRGCRNKCLYCAVPKIEGTLNSEKISIKKYIWPGHTKIIFFDNNLLASCYWEEIFKEVLELKMEVDFNQGLEAHLLNEKSVSLIAKMNIPAIRLAYDTINAKEDVKNAIELLDKKGVDKRRIFVYTLFNYTDTPDDFFFRVRDILKWGAICYPMRFQPCVTLKKDAHISPNWTSEQLNMVASARRVFGYGGAFPPYNALIDRFIESKKFEDIFKVYPKKEKEPTDKKTVSKE